MELGTFYAVFTQYWGFGPLTWNINRKSMLKPKFAMVHVNQRKRCSILMYFAGFGDLDHLTWNLPGYDQLSAT